MPEVTIHTREILTIADFLTPEECAAHIARAEAEGFGAAPITTADGPKLAPGTRNNTRVMIRDEVLAADLWARVQPFAPSPWKFRAACGVNELFRIYRYDPGQRFHWHHDAAYERPDFSARSQFTFMIYLNAGFEGGATEFDEPMEVVPRTGTALLFAHHLVHQGAEVRRGRKYVLRTDVMYAAPARGA